MGWDKKSTLLPLPEGSSGLCLLGRAFFAGA